MERKEIVQILKEIVSQNKIRKAYLFGSFARKHGRFNDIDLAIEPLGGFTLLDLARVANTIEERTGLHVDLVTLRSLNPRLKSIIKREMVAI